MPNWCSSSIIIKSKKGNEKEVQRLHQAISLAYSTPSEIENSFELGWLGKIAASHSLNWEDVPCRGTIIEFDDEVHTGNFEDEGEFSYFRVDTESAWSPMTELWEAIVEQYDGVSFVYIAEEAGNGIFINSDATGLFFCDRYVLEICCNTMSVVPNDWAFDGIEKPAGDENGLADLDIREFFDSFESLKDFFTKLTGKEFDCHTEMAEYLDGIAIDADGVKNAYFMASVNEFTLE